MIKKEPWLGDPAKTIEILQKYGFRFQKKFGQNFLIDTHVLDKIVDAAEITEEDFVLEIGPGIGTLTQYLACRAGRVCAVEIDSNLIPILEETLRDWDNVVVIHDDIMKMDLWELAQKMNGGKPFKVVANLPYYITTPIIMGLLEKQLPIESVTVMIQKEVAMRMQAAPGSKDYGALSLAVQYYSQPYLAANVPPNCFMPRPQVGSAVIRLRVLEKPSVEVNNASLMFALIKASFGQRRKTLMNGLRNEPSLHLEKDTILKALACMGLPEGIRGETLSLDQFARLSDTLEKLTERSPNESM